MSQKVLWTTFKTFDLRCYEQFLFLFSVESGENDIHCKDEKNFNWITRIIVLKRIKRKYFKTISDKFSGKQDQIILGIQIFF